MNTPDKHSALRKAFTPQDGRALSSNFAYTTMRRIRHEQRESERRQRAVSIATTVLVAVFGIGLLAYAFGPLILQALLAMLRRQDAIMLTLPTLFCLTFFALLNHWLSRRYSTHAA